MTKDRVPTTDVPKVTTRGNLASALLATEMIDRLLEYSKTGEDRHQVAWSWANRIGDWLDQVNGSWASEQPAPPLDVRRQVVEQIRREFRRPENMLTSFKAYTPDEPQGFMKAYVAEAVDRILDEVARDD